MVLQLRAVFPSLAGCAEARLEHLRAAAEPVRAVGRTWRQNCTCRVARTNFRKSANLPLAQFRNFENYQFVP